MLSVASVMMNGWGNRPQTYPAPLTKPTAAPVASITTMTTAAPLPLRKARAPRTEASASVEPTDRSMPLVMMTSSWPIASKAIAAVCDRMLPTLPVVRNTGDSERHGDDEAGEDEDRSETDHRQGATKQSIAAARAHVVVRFAVDGVGGRGVVTTGRQRRRRHRPVDRRFANVLIATSPSALRRCRRPSTTRGTIRAQTSHV